MIQDLIQKYKKEGIVFQIIFWNVALFLISLPLFYHFKAWSFSFPSYIAFDTRQWYFAWTMITYAFFHNGVWHLVFNMLFLYFFSNLFFTFFNSKQFIRLYFFGIVFSVIFAYLAHFVLGISYFKVVGASGVTSVIFFAIASFAPNYRISLILFSLEIWIIAGIMFLIYVTMLYAGDQGGNLVHLGGAIGGILWGYYIKKGVEISGFLENIFNLFDKKSQKSKIKTVYSNQHKSIVKNQKSSDQAKIDAILDKISKSGYESLSSEEKSFLFNQKDH
jgi:membrane associated rhomboid family serine protease